MECIYWVKRSSDGKDNVYVRVEGDLRTISNFSLVRLLKLPLRNYSPIVPLGVCLTPQILYRWNDDD